MHATREEVEALHWSQLAQLYRLEHSLDAVRSAVASLAAKSEGRDVVSVLSEIEAEAASLYQKKIDAMKRAKMPAAAISAMEAELNSMKKKWSWND